MGSRPPGSSLLKRLRWTGATPHLWWSALALCVGLWTRAGDAQVLVPVSDSRELYCRGALACMDPVEARSTPAAPFAAFEDTVWTMLQGCSPFAAVGANAEQKSYVFEDSIYVYERVDADLGGVHGLTSIARAEVPIVFRIESGHRYNYLFYAEGWLNASGAIAIVSASLSGNGVRDTLHLQAGPRPWDQGKWKIFRGTLAPGDYAIDLHASVECINYRGWGFLWASLKLYRMTAVVPSTWGGIKSLYREERRQSPQSRRG